MNEIDKHIILIGFMGTGKTTIGFKLANHLERNFIDIDKEIELKEKLSINEIFSSKGENYFRQVETDVLNRVTNCNMPSVISTGGGIILTEENRSAMNNSLVILLTAAPETIYNRIKEDSSRPLLNDKNNLLSQISTILEQRERIYKEISDYIIDTERKDVNETVSLILKYIKERE